jgi:isopenicillin-N N-acyltransferase-like protein
MPPWKIGVLNARTEIHIRTLLERSPGECTAIFSPRGPVIGENWDWMQPCEDLMAVLELERPDGHRILMIAEPGIIGKVGLSSAGIGVCLNIIHGHGFEFGIPIHILLRLALDAPSIDAAEEALATSPFWTHSHIILADERGAYRSLEFHAGEMRGVEYGNEPAIHTNHFMAFDNSDEDDPLFENSQRRLERAREIAGGACEDDGVAILARILSDREGGSDAICAPYKEVFHFVVGTVASMIVDLSSRTIHFTDGNPIDHGYRCVSMA